MNDVYPLMILLSFNLMIYSNKRLIQFPDFVVFEIVTFFILVTIGPK